jgi:hypothetical protein
MYDIFFILNNDLNLYLWNQCKEKYPRAQLLKNINNFQEIKSKAFTKMFWVIWDDLELDNNFDLNSYCASKWDDMYIHVFRNGIFYDGICLFSKDVNVGKKELENRFFTNKKEIDIKSSDALPYDIFYLDSYTDYKKALDDSKTEMFWVVWNDVILRKDFDFSFQVPKHNQRITHIFLNKNCFDGICLFSKRKPISQREFDFRFFLEKKEVEIIASDPAVKKYDIVFISYDEINADKNFEKLKSRFPNIKRIHGIKGIHQAHIEAAKICSTDLFYVVDADAIILDDFNFDYYVETWNRDSVHVWKSQNPINDLEYGYGGVKLLPRKLTLDLDVNTTDMTTSISTKFKIVDQISNITEFNTDEFNTWKSAFRECVKLSSKIIERQQSDETQKRLDIWCKVGEEKLFGKYALLGANSGKIYGEINRNNKKSLSLINNFDWLKNKFLEDIK